MNNYYKVAHTDMEPPQRMGLHMLWITYDPPSYLMFRGFILGCVFKSVQLDLNRVRLMDKMRPQNLITCFRSPLL